jgi:hypothetical protein
MLAPDATPTANPHMNTFSASYIDRAVIDILIAIQVDTYSSET